MKWITVLLGVLVVIFLVTVILSFVFSNNKSEGDYVYNNRLQAVFLNTGQVYFGNIKSINPQFLVLQNIFYLQTNSASGSATTSSSSSNNVSLIKLGCELHAPYDQMVINMTEVTFWENLHNSGQVAKAVSKYYQNYPNGQKCSSSSNVGSSTPAASAPATSTPTTSLKSGTSSKP